MIGTSVYYKLQPLAATLYYKYISDIIFVHINKTGGSSVEKALGLPFQHKTARELRAELGAERWASRFSFAFIRNPWDKVASHYHYRVQTNQTGLGTNPIPFNDWVRLAYGANDPKYYDNPKMFMAQTDWICDEDGSILVDFIGRFETLEADFREVCRRIGRTAELPHLKKSRRGDYRGLYDAEAVEIVARCFASDIERFGYRFE